MDIRQIHVQFMSDCAAATRAEFPEIVDLSYNPRQVPITHGECNISGQSVWLWPAKGDCCKPVKRWRREGLGRYPEYICSCGECVS